MKERIHKVLARAGLGSRREIERWVSDGRIKVNGRTAAPGLQISERDRVEVDGENRAASPRPGGVPRVSSPTTSPKVRFVPAQHVKSAPPFFEIYHLSSMADGFRLVVWTLIQAVCCCSLTMGIWHTA